MTSPAPKTVGNYVTVPRVVVKGAEEHTRLLFLDLRGHTRH